MARTGLIRKFTGGAAGSLADSFSDEHKAQILAKRDQRLAELREKSTLQQQQFQTQRDERGHAQALERDQRKMDHDKEMLDLKAEKLPGGGIEPTANQKDVAAMVNAGVFESDKDAWNFLNNTKQAGSIVRVFQMLHDQQTEQYLEPGDKGYKSPKKLLEEAQMLVSGLGQEEKPKGTPPPMFQFGNQGGGQGGGSAQREAPQAAIQALSKDPTLADQFKAKYGYLPAPYK